LVNGTIKIILEESKRAEEVRPSTNCSTKFLSQMGNTT